MISLMLLVLCYNEYISLVHISFLFTSALVIQGVVLIRGWYILILESNKYSDYLDAVPD